MATTLTACSVTNTIAGIGSNKVKRFICLKIGETSNSALVTNSPYTVKVYDSSNNLLYTNVFSVLPGANTFYGWTIGADYTQGSTSPAEFTAGTYLIELYSSQPGLPVTTSVVMNDPTALSSTYITTINANCGSGVGTANFLVAGTLPVSYRVCSPSGGNWVCSSPVSSGNITSNSTSINLPVGTYDVEFTYKTQCPCYPLSTTFNYERKTFVIGVNQSPIGITSTVVDTVCATSVGSITISVTGQAPHTYSWSGPNGFTSTNADIFSLEAGVYTVNVTDANGCTGSSSITVASVPDPNGCGGPVTCYKLVNCNPDCFGTTTFFITDSDLAPLVGYVINGVQIEGQVINPEDCWQVLETEPGDTVAPQLPCYNNFDIGSPAGPLRYCSITVNGTTSIYTGPTNNFNTAAFITQILTPGNIIPGFTVTAGNTATSFSICSNDPAYSNAPIQVSYQWFNNGPKAWTSVGLTVVFSPYVPGTGCYAADVFIGYNTAFSTCELCKPVECPVEPTYERVKPDPVKIYYQIRESACDIKAVKQFATAYSNMLKKLKYGIGDCCNGLNIGETWVNKQISNLQENIIQGYNCRDIPMQGCSWLPLEGCEILDTPYGNGTSILATAGEDITYGKLVMLSTNGLLYLNQPANTNNYQRAVGFSMAGVAANQTLRVLITGIIADPAWNLIPGAIYYASPNGGITSIIPTSGISQMVGIATDQYTLVVELKQPNIL